LLQPHFFKQRQTVCSGFSGCSPVEPAEEHEAERSAATFPCNIFSSEYMQRLMTMEMDGGTEVLADLILAEDTVSPAYTPGQDPMTPFTWANAQTVLAWIRANLPDWDFSRSNVGWYLPQPVGECVPDAKLVYWYPWVPPAGEDPDQIAAEMEDAGGDDGGSEPS
jgi:hypothetical protein